MFSGKKGGLSGFSALLLPLGATCTGAVGTPDQYSLCMESCHLVYLKQQVWLSPEGRGFWGEGEGFVWFREQGFFCWAPFLLFIQEQVLKLLPPCFSNYIQFLFLSSLLCSFTSSLSPCSFFDCWLFPRFPCSLTHSLFSVLHFLPDFLELIHVLPCFLF